MKDTVEMDTEKYGKSWELICRTFSSPFQDTYRGGKTCLRDLLYDQLGYSLLEAEEMVDEMERSGKISFARLRKGSRFGAWEIRKE